MARDRQVGATPADDVDQLPLDTDADEDASPRQMVEPTYQPIKEPVREATGEPVIESTERPQVTYRPGLEPTVPSGALARVQANLAALELLREIGDGPATAEQQQVLAGWSSWGAVPEVFDPGNVGNQMWRTRLASLLNTAEWNAASRTTINAHYTDPRLVEAMWQSLTDLGLPVGARVLEPGCGSGNFIGRAPQQTRVVGVELDPTTARIAKLLYPQADIRAESFADTRNLGPIDAVIGNVPFADVTLHDSAYNRGRHSMHNHFIIKALSMTQPGGVAALLTSRYTLDSQNPAAREEMAELGTLLGALRLPEGTHYRTAGTNVVTDLLLFHRHTQPPAADRPRPDWLDTSTVEIDGITVRMNQLFLNRPEWVLGRLSVEHGQYAEALTVKPPAGIDRQDLPSRLAADVDDALSGITRAATDAGLTWQQAAQPQAVARVGGPTEAFLGHLREDPLGGFEVATQDGYQPFAVPATQATELRHLLTMRDLYVKLITAEAGSEVDTAEHHELRADLNDSYDRYLATYGPINRFTETESGRTRKGADEPSVIRRYPPAVTRFRGDPHAVYVRALEIFDEAAQTASKAAILRGRVLTARTPQTKASSPADALALCMDQLGRVDLDRIGQLLDVDNPDLVVEQLGDLIYEQPTSVTQTGHAADEAEAESAGLRPLNRAAFVHTTAPARAVCARCDEPIDEGSPAVSVPGLNQRGLAHEHCVTPPLQPGQGPTATRGEYVPAAQYLSGQVRHKLTVARAAAIADPRFQRNVDALEKVIPADLQPGEISARLGAVWIGPDDVQAFLRQTLADDRLEVTKTPVEGWKVAGGMRQTIQAREEWGTTELPAHKIAQLTLNQQPVRVIDYDQDGNPMPNPTASEAAREKAERLQERFGEWVWDDPGRAARLAGRYNELFNGTVTRRDYVHGTMALPGLARGFTPAPHQLNAVARVIQDGSAGVYHPVGYGKTAVMVMAAMEQRRLGLINKPALIVPNHMLEQAQREWLQMYPAARLLAASTDDLTRERRRSLIAQVTNGEWDGIIMTRSAFAKLPVSAAELRRYLEDEVAPLREAFQAQLAAGGERSQSVKRAEKALLQLEERVKSKLDSQRDIGVTFEQTGIDFLIVDELHDYKNLTTPSKIPGGGVAQGSQRATDLHQKVSYLRRVHGDRAILGATATPISNSVSEVYVMLRHLKPEILDQANIASFDDWAATFGQTVTAIELAPAGQTWREATRFARFQNVPELLQMWTAVGDTVDTEEVPLPRPDLARRSEDGQRIPAIVRVPASDELADLTTQLGERAEAVRSRLVEPQEDNMLKITNEGRLAALDLRLTPQYRARVGEWIDLGLTVPTKVESAAANIYRIWAEYSHHTYLDTATGEPHPRPGALQLVFCDLGTPKPDGSYNVYDDLRRQLIDYGIPADQVRFMHEARNDAEKARMFEQARTGGIQVLIGSTSRMGVGTNVQNRAIALHHLDCTWKPAEIEQREGRIIRRGNQHSEVQIYRYATEKSFDAYMWQTVARKAKFIDQVMSGRVDTREIDDIASDETISYEEMQAIVSGNPYLREKHEVESEIAKLERLARHHRQADQALQHTITSTRADIERLEAVRIPGLKDAIDHTRSTRGDDFLIEFDGPAGPRRYDKRPDAAVALARAANRYLADNYGRRAEPEPIGRFAGHTLRADRDPLNVGGIKIIISDHLSPVVFAAGELANPQHGHVVRLENAVDQLPRQLALAEARLAEQHDQLRRAQKRQGEPFGQTERLTYLRQRQTEINQAIADLAKPSETQPEPNGQFESSGAPPEAASMETDLTPEEVAEAQAAASAQSYFPAPRHLGGASPDTNQAPGSIPQADSRDPGPRSTRPDQGPSQRH